jgi:CheY-like chemotaxis protein
MSTPTPSAYTILIVDDDPFICGITQKVLARAGYQVLVTQSGPEAIRLNQERAEPIDLVICDLLMPEIDGFAVVAGLRAHPRTRDIPILVLTGHDVTEAEKARLNGNILGVVGKGATAEQGLREWLRRVTRATPPPSAPPVTPGRGGGPSS